MYTEDFCWPLVNIDDTIGSTKHGINCLIDSTNGKISYKYVLFLKSKIFREL